MTANEYIKSIQDNFDGINKNLEQIQPVTGKWIERPHGLTSICECSKCGYIDNYYFDRGQSKFKYCPNCRCRMVEPQERSDKE